MDAGMLNRRFVDSLRIFCYSFGYICFAPWFVGWEVVYFWVHPGIWISQKGALAGDFHTADRSLEAPAKWVCALSHFHSYIRTVFVYSLFSLYLSGIFLSSAIVKKVKNFFLFLPCGILKKPCFLKKNVLEFTVI